MTRTTLLPLLVLCFAGMAGCHLYVEEGGGRDECRGDCAPPSSEPDSPSSQEPDASLPWQTCETAAECGAGFSCDFGYCEEDQPIDTEEPEVETCVINWQCGPGCYCNPAGICEPVVDVECSDLVEVACGESDDCYPVYGGVNCVASDGSDCSGSDADCQCESFEYDRCTDS